MPRCQAHQKASRICGWRPNSPLSGHAPSSVPISCARPLDAIAKPSCSSACEGWLQFLHNPLGAQSCTIVVGGFDASCRMSTSERRCSFPVAVRCIGRPAAPPAVIVAVVSPRPPMTVAWSDCVSLGYPAVEVDMQNEAFPTTAGFDPEVGRPGAHEANAVIAAFLQLVAHLVGVMAGWSRWSSLPVAGIRGDT